MKMLRSVLKILGLALAAAAVALFFFDFVTMSVGTASAEASGINLVFGGNVDVNGTTGSLQMSAYYTAAFFLTILTAVLAAFGIKKTASQVASMIFGAITGALFAVINAGKGTKFVDIRDLDDLGAVSGVTMTRMAWIACGLVFASVAVAIVGLLVNDAIIVRDTGKKSIFSKCISFLKEYRVELKKVTWPTWANVLKNTIVVIVISLVIGAFIWLLDWGLSELFQLILS